MGKKKNFVLDTNVILHDYKALEKFEDNDVYLPIVVLEELDRFKKGNEQLNYNAREFTRELNIIAKDMTFSDGVSLGAHRGKLFIRVPKKDYPVELAESFSAKTADHRILAIALELTKEKPEEQVILVTKDINLRMKAKSLNMIAQDFTNDKVTNLDVLDKHATLFNDVPLDIINEVYENKTGIPMERVSFVGKLVPNQCCIFKNGSSSILLRFNQESQLLMKVDKRRTYGIDPRNSEQTFALDALLDPNIQLVALTGRAGTGKTLLALAAALQQANLYSQILLARPIVALSDRDLGFLPGDEKQKIGPYMIPLFDNLAVIKQQFSPLSNEVEKINELQREEKLVITPLAYIRGRSLSDTFFIVDEAQNLTPHEIKTIITRAGEGTKIIITGDIQQIDSPYLDMHSNGLSYLTDKMQGQAIFSHINLIKGERSFLSELASSLL